MQKIAHAIFFLIFLYYLYLTDIIYYISNILLILLLSIILHFNLSKLIYRFVVKTFKKKAMLLNYLSYYRKQDQLTMSLVQIVTFPVIVPQLKLRSCILCA